MDGALCNATPVHNVQRHSEEPKQCTLAVEQGPGDPEEPSISDSEAVSDGDEEHYETASPHLAMRPVVQQKEKHEQPVTQGAHPQGAPSVTEFTTYRPHIQAELVDRYAISAKARGTPDSRYSGVDSTTCLGMR